MKKLMPVAAVFLAGIFAGGVLMKAQNPPAASKLPAERVTGIGGVFFKAEDPKALSAWYRDSLGLTLQDGGFAIFAWRESEDQTRVGHTVWSLFPSTTKYFGPGDASLMINYRVRDLDRMLAQLRTLGVNIDPKIEDDFNGRFAHIFDPEGNRIQLWEPKAGY